MFPLSSPPAILAPDTVLVPLDLAMVANGAGHGYVLGQKVVIIAV
jgi:hypothetical protein